MIFENLRSTALFLCVTLLIASCSKGDDGPHVPEVPLLRLTEGDEIIISDIAGIPDGVAFDRIGADITGLAWTVIATVKAAYTGGSALLALPVGFDRADLCKVTRDDAGDYYGFWPAEEVDNPEAKVAGLSDIHAYSGEEIVGRIYLTDSQGEGPVEYYNYIFYHYADQPFSLSGYNLTVGSNPKSFMYQASFDAGWNAYIQRRGDLNLVTTTIPENLSLSWRFEKWGQ